MYGEVKAPELSVLTLQASDGVIMGSIKHIKIRTSIVRLSC